MKKLSDEYGKRLADSQRPPEGIKVMGGGANPFRGRKSSSKIINQTTAEDISLYTSTEIIHMFIRNIIKILGNNEEHIKELHLPSAGIIGVKTMKGGARRGNVGESTSTWRIRP